MFQAMYAVRERMDRAFSTHGSLSLVSDVKVCLGLSNFVSLQFTRPVRRYSRAGWGVAVPARLAWFLQELPSFVVPLFISLGRYDDFQNLHIHNTALIGCSLMHYFQRLIHNSDMSIIQKFLTNQNASNETIIVMTPYCPSPQHLLHMQEGVILLSSMIFGESKCPGHLNFL